MISEALKQIRIFHGQTQRELADALGLSQSFISELEGGTKDPSLEVLDKYATHFGLPKSAILFFAEEMDTHRAGDRIRRQVSRRVISLLKFISGE